MKKNRRGGLKGREERDRGRRARKAREGDLARRGAYPILFLVTIHVHVGDLARRGEERIQEKAARKALKEEEAATCLQSQQRGKTSRRVVALKASLLKYMEEKKRRRKAFIRHGPPKEETPVGPWPFTGVEMPLRSYVPGTEEAHGEPS